jgi:ClpA/ClpB-like protein
MKLTRRRSAPVMRSGQPAVRMPTPAVPAAPVGHRRAIRSPLMFERFTERARQVVVLAQEEARTLGHSYIGTEHLLLGLLREREGLAARVLESLGIELGRVREEVVRSVGTGEETVAGRLPFTPDAKKVLELALREALNLHHSYIGPEHILLGLARDDGGVAIGVLVYLNADSEKIRSEVLRMVGSTATSTRVSGPADTGPTPEEPGLPLGLGTVTRQLIGPAVRLLPALAVMVRDDGRRPADEGDLLLAMAAPGGLIERALTQAGLELTALRRAIEDQRGKLEPREPSELAGARSLAARADRLALEQRQAIMDSDFERAGRLRSERARVIDLARQTTQEHELSELRERLGLPGPSAPPDLR